MTRVLVIHGAGMNMRGKVQVDIFGPMTLPEYDERIRGYAKELGVEVEIFHSNIEGEIVNRLYKANDEGFDAAIFNPAAFGTGYPALVAAISQVKFPTVEVHISNPIRRGPASQTAAVSQSVVAGFGIAGYVNFFERKTEAVLKLVDKPSATQLEGSKRSIRCRLTSG
jgi:3-dehydroquinate dehydratase II